MEFAVLITSGRIFEIVGAAHQKARDAEHSRFEFEELGARLGLIDKNSPLNWRT